MVVGVTGDDDGVTGVIVATARGNTARATRLRGAHARRIRLRRALPLSCACSAAVTSGGSYADMWPFSSSLSINLYLSMAWA